MKCLWITLSFGWIPQLPTQGRTLHKSLSGTSMGQIRAVLQNLIILEEWGLQAISYVSIQRILQGWWASGASHYFSFRTRYSSFHVEDGPCVGMGALPS